MTVSDQRPRSLRAGIASNRMLRTIALPVLRRLDVPITIKNPFSGHRFHLLSFTHKGYWFYGQHREQASMARCAQLISAGDRVVEVGGHIGFLSQFFARQVGQNGQVHIFEPGRQNQEFLRKNLAHRKNCAHVNAAVADYNGKATFYEENLGGFMNSLDAGFARSSNIAASQRAVLNVQPRQVNTVTLDAYATAHNVWPQFLKIDVEGGELAVLRGGTKVLQNTNALMIEVTRNRDRVMELLRNQGFVLSTPDGEPIDHPAQMDGNIFAIRAS